MNAIFFITIKKYTHIFLFSFFFFEFCNLAIAADKSPVKVSNFSNFKFFQKDEKKILINKKSKTVIFLIKNQQLKISKIGTFNLYQYVQRNNRSIILFLKKNTDALSKSFIGTEFVDKSKYYFNPYGLVCNDSSKSILSNFKKQDIQSVINSYNLEELIDKKSCKNVSSVELSFVLDKMKEILDVNNGKIINCLKSSDVQKILDKDFGLRENIGLFLSRFIDLATSLKTEAHSLSITCEISNPSNKNFASYNSLANPPQITLYHENGKLNMDQNIIDKVLEHELFHFGVSQIQNKSEKDCLDENYAQLFSNICSANTTADFSNTKFQTSDDILKICSNKELISKKLNESEKFNYTNGSAEGNGELVAKTQEQISSRKSQENEAASQIVVHTASSADFKAVADKDIERLIADLPVVGPTKDGEAISMPTEVFGGSFERVMAVGSTAMNSASKLIEDSMDKVATLGATGALAAVNSKPPRDPQISYYSTGQIMADIYSNSGEGIDSSTTSTLNPNLLATNTIRPAKSATGSQSASAVAVTTIAAVSSNETLTKARATASATSAIGVQGGASLKTSGAGFKNDSNPLAIQGAPSTFAVKAAGIETKNNRGVASVDPQKVNSQAGNLEESENPNSGNLNRTVKSAGSAQMDNSYLQGFAGYKTISGNTYSAFKSYIEKSSSSEQISRRRIFIYNNQKKAIAGQAVNAEHCFLDRFPIKEFVRETCPKVKKR